MLKSALLGIGLLVAATTAAAAQSYYPYAYPGYPTYSYPYAYSSYNTPTLTRTTAGLIRITVGPPITGLRPTVQRQRIPTLMSGRAPIQTALGRKRVPVADTDRGERGS
jgi:hypothetical protein